MNGIKAAALNRQLECESVADVFKNVPVINRNLDEVRLFNNIRVFIVFVSYGLVKMLLVCHI